MRNSECGIEENAVLVLHSAFRIPHSAFRIIHVIFFCSPITTARRKTGVVPDNVRKWRT